MFKVGDVLTCRSRVGINGVEKISVGEKCTIYAYKEGADGIYMYNENKDRYIFYINPNVGSYIWTFFDITEYRMNKIKKIKERMYGSR